MIEWTINQTDYTLLETGYGDKVIGIHWTARKTDQALAASSYDLERVDPESTLGQTPYAEVTEQMCIEYLEANLDLVAIEADLDLRLLAQEQPQTGSGKPWVDNYPQWKTGQAYAIDDVVAYQGESYRVIQAHTSSAEWPPSLTPALFAPYVPPDAGPQPWVQPVGSEDAYPIGAQVTHTGNLWTSLVDANVWEPTSAVPTLWQDEGVYP